MKTKLLLLLLSLFIFSCSTPDKAKQTDQCDCLKTYYLFYPAMGSGSSYVPSHYDVVSSIGVTVNCNDETNDYVSVSNSQYSHYKINCD
jgi:hypothetical protein